MAKAGSRLASMRVDELMKLRDHINSALNRKTAKLKKQLERLESGGWVSSRRKGIARRPRKGRKLLPKYRDPNDPSLVWSGRGVKPRWMQERIQAGAKQEDFLIAEGAAASPKPSVGKRSAAKKRRKPKKRRKLN